MDRRSSARSSAASSSPRSPTGRRSVRAGSLAGALATAALGGLKRRGALLIGASVSFGVLLVVFTLQRALLPTLPLLVLLGFSTMVFLGMANGLLQTRSPDHLRGRVMSVYTMVFMGLMPLGSMVMGSIGSVVG